MSYATEQSVLNTQWNAAQSAQLPSVLYRPRLMADGDMWCALYGDDLATGVAGFGKTPAEAMHEFDKAWGSALTPAAAYAARSNQQGADGALEAFRKATQDGSVPRGYPHPRDDHWLSRRPT